MTDFSGCQLPNVPKFATGTAGRMGKSPVMRIKSMLAVPWNYHVKKWIKLAYHTSIRQRGTSLATLAAREFAPAVPLKSGDVVRVRSREEIDSTLDPFKELKGCAFLPDMYQYCDSRQRVLRAMQHFLDERDYKLKKVHGVILLENIICNGTPAFGPCDRCCFLFWREEWLEKLPEH
jgi:hypothetical protein